MVAKLSIGSSLYGVLAYNAQKVNAGKEGNSVFDGGDGQMNCTQLLKDTFLRDNPQVEIMAFEKIEHGCKPPCTHIPAIILKTSTQQKGEKTHLHLFTLLVCFKIKLPLRRLLTL